MLWLDLGTKFFVIVRAIGVDADINRVLYSSRKYPIPQFVAIIQYVLQERPRVRFIHTYYLSPIVPFYVICAVLIIIVSCRSNPFISLIYQYVDANDKHHISEG